MNDKDAKELGDLVLKTSAIARLNDYEGEYGHRR